jgi:hypothetical protein
MSSSLTCWPRSIILYMFDLFSNCYLLCLESLHLFITPNIFTQILHTMNIICVVINFNSIMATHWVIHGVRLISTLIVKAIFVKERIFFFKLAYK